MKRVFGGRGGEKMSEPPSDYDSPWKEALERYFEAFIAFFFPQAHADIDWTKGYEFLDKELQRVVRDAEIGRRLVDKLVKVWRRSGTEAWVLAHVEVQGQEETDFAERIYVYNYRLFDRYHRLVASLVVLADEQDEWRPNKFGYNLWGCEVGFKFPVVKLLDYREQWSALENSQNPFAMVVMAHLKAQATRRDPEGRLQWKLSLVKELYERGYRREDILELFRFVDWLMVLPEDLERRFEENLTRYEEGKNMPYITSVERIGIQKGIQQGIQQGILQNAREDVIDILETRFVDVPQSIVATINDIEDTSILKILHKKAITVGSLPEFEDTLKR
jgi:hypothetical protein